eukprot:TRINITY_DN33679_c0_g1_i1.p1 TRINITY_DN33679_c0_g1~~TRINITY_DN33679_c0_g1_i1.p1  ORF type:complete len:449 (-),score=84.48 TRINITY_DN33679_c0_g1_i1:93-1439(-)
MAAVTEANGGSGLAAQLNVQARALLPIVRELLDCPQLTPQQAMGSLSILSEVVGRLMCNLEDPEALDKFRRVKATALRKKLGNAADSAFKVLGVGGFSLVGEQLVWEDTCAGLLAALTLQTAISDLQQRFQSGGARAIKSLQDLNITPTAVLATTNNTSLLPRSGAASANSLGSALLQQAWLEENAPDLAAMLTSTPRLADMPNMREKAACKQLRRELTTVRERSGSQALQGARLLDEMAQLLAGFDRIQRRSNDECRQKDDLSPSSSRGPVGDQPQEPVFIDNLGNVKRGAEEGKQAPSSTREKGGDANTAAICDSTASTTAEVAGTVSDDTCHAAVRSTEANGAERVKADARETLETLLRCIPAFRLGPPHGALSEVVHLREYPSFFTAGMNEKQFFTALEALAQRVITSWTENPQVMGNEWSVLGVGCSIDITHDDCMNVFAILG